MSKVLTFKVYIKGLENKIWRKIEITDKSTIADLVYTILATFDSLAYHLYDIKYNNKRYDSIICSEDYHGDEELVDATITKMSDISLISNDTMIMEYDYGATTTFIITYLECRELEKGNGRHYPFIIDGQGRGMIDDMTSDELKEIVSDIDKKGYSVYNYTPGYERKIKYDYRDYKIDVDNALLKGNIKDIKYGYEIGE